MDRYVVMYAAVVIICRPPQALSAQSDGSLSVVGTVEHTRITEDDGFLGDGFGGAFGVEFHLTAATSLEVEFGQQRHVRNLDLFAVAHDPQGRLMPLPYTEQWKGTATFILGLVSHAFGSARARPVVWGGVGLMSHGGTLRWPLVMPKVPSGFELQAFDAQTRRGRVSRAFAMDGGAGVDAGLTRRLTLRPFVGLRLASTGNFGPKYIVRTGARIGVRW